MLPKLKIIILESPYNTLIDNPLAQEFFSKMCELKIKGYSKMYKHGVLPLDSTDFVGTHLLLCEEINGKYEALMGYKSTTLSICEYYRIPFAIHEIVKKHGSNECCMEMENIISSCVKNKQEISYDTSWTINPRVRENKELQIAIKEITCAIAVHHHQDYNIPYWFTFGIVKHKTDQYFLKWGAREVSNKPDLKQPVLFNTDAKTIVCDVSKYSEFALELAKKYKNLWDSKLMLSNPIEINISAA